MSFLGNLFKRKPKPKPFPSTVKELNTWLTEELNKGTPRQELVMTLYKIEPWDLAEGTQVAIMRAADSLSQLMFQRNMKGSELERAGDIDKATALFEANVVDRFVGKHPYERLRVIYTKKKDYANAIRVCEAYLAIPKPPSKKAEDMRSHLEKLKQKQQ